MRPFLPLIFVSLCLTVAAKEFLQSPVASLDEKTAQARVLAFLNSSNSAPLEAMMEKLKGLSQSELQSLVNQTLGGFNVTGNLTALREGKQYGGGFGGFGGFGGISPLLLLLLGSGSRSSFYPPPPINNNNGGDLATLSSLILLGLALISRFPTQG